MISGLLHRDRHFTRDVVAITFVLSSVWYETAAQSDCQHAMVGGQALARAFAQRTHTTLSAAAVRATTATTRRAGGMGPSARLERRHAKQMLTTMVLSVSVTTDTHQQVALISMAIHGQHANAQPATTK